MRLLYAATVLAIAGCASAEGVGAVAEPPSSESGDPRVPTANLPRIAESGLVSYPRIGNTRDDPVDPLGPALVLAGGETKVPSAFAWMHEVIAGNRRWAGDVVVVTMEPDDSYAQAIASAAQFNSAQTIRILPSANDDDFAAAANIVELAEAVFFVGEDAVTIARWRRTALGVAIQAAFDRGAVVGGTGGGASVLGDFALEGNVPVSTTEAITDPYASPIRFTRHVFDIPQLEALIVEPHFRDDDRFGRLSAFMARQVADGALASTPPRVLGIGVDEGAAALVDRFGRVTLAQNEASVGSVFVLEGGTPQQITPGEPLVYLNLSVTRLESPGEVYDLNRRCGTAFGYAASVQGALNQPYSPADPYVAAGLPKLCP